MNDKNRDTQNIANQINKSNSFLEYTKKREAMGLNVINVAKKEEQIEYLQKRHSETKNKSLENNFSNLSSLEKQFNIKNVIVNSKNQKKYLTRTKENNSENILEDIYNDKYLDNNQRKLHRKELDKNINFDIDNSSNDNVITSIDDNHYIKKYYGDIKDIKNINGNVTQNNEDTEIYKITENKKETKNKIFTKKELSNIIKNIEEKIYIKHNEDTQLDIDKNADELNNITLLTNGIIVKGGYIATEEYRKHRDTQTTVLKRNMDNRRQVLRNSEMFDNEILEKQKRYNDEILKPYKKYGQIIKTNIQNKENKEENTMEDKEIFLTQEGYDNLEQELSRLKSSERDIIAERIKVAKAHGDLSENAEYDEAKRAQENNENQIARLEYMLEVAQIIDRDEIDLERVQVGNTVYITNIANKKEQKYTIVGTAEANILQGKISNESPIAKSLLDAKVGDIVQVEAPIGIIEYKVKKITLE